MAVNLLELICCSRHNMATCMTWDDLQLPVHWTYSYLKEITVAISRTLTNLITSYYQTNCQVNIGLYALSCPEAIAAMLSIMSVGVYCPLRMLNNLSNIHILMIHISMGTDTVLEGMVLDINTDLLLHGLIVVVLDNHTPGHTLTELLPSGSKFNNTCYACKHFTTEAVATPTPLAYIIGTTGTTGAPKQVCVPHCCIVPNIVDLRQRYSLSCHDRIFNAAPLTFDPSIVEIFISLSCGGTLVMAPDHVKRHPPSFVSVLCNRQCVTVLQTTPSLLSLLSPDVISSTVLGEHTTLRVLALGGEVCPTTSTLATWRCAKNRTKLFNLYGITEVSSWASCYEITEHNLRSPNNDMIPLGEPLMDTILEVRDDCNAPVKSGYGIIWIGGKNRVCLVDGERCGMRCSGDVGFVEDSNIYIVGRCDRQIKRFGHRINLDYLEQKLLRSPLIGQCSMVGSHDTLTCYAAPAVACKDVRKAITMQIRKLLLAHERPNVLIVVEHIPVNPNGKIDPAGIIKVDPIVTSNDVINNDVMYDVVKRAIEDVMGLAIDKDIQKSLSEYGATSFDIVRIVNALEEILGSNYRDAINSNITGLYELLTSCSIGEIPRNIVEIVGEQGAAFISTDIANTDAKVSVKRTSSIEESNEEKKFHGSEANGTSHDVSHGVVNYRRGAVFHRGRMVPFIDGDDSVLWCTMAIKWAVPCGRCVDASPLLVHGGSGNIVYIGSHSGLLLAIDNGAVLWRTSLPDRIESSCCISHDNRYVIVGCYDGSVYVVSASDGAIYWVVKGDDSVKSSPAVHPTTGYVWYGSHDKHLYSIDIEAKLVIHKIYVDGGSCYSSITFYDELVVVATLGGTIAAVNMVTGGVVWRYSCNKPIFSSPSIMYDYILCGCVDGRVYILHCNNGHLVTTLATGGPIFSSPVYYYQSQNQSHDRAIVLCGSHDCHMYCWDYNNHVFTYKWSLKLDSEIYAIPCLGHVTRLPYQPSCEPCPVNSVCVCSSKGSMYLVGVASGDVIGQYTLPGPVYSSPVLFNNSVIVGCRDDNVYCIKITVKFS